MKLILLVLSITSFMFADGKIGGVTYFDLNKTDDATAFNFTRQYFSYGGEVSDKVDYNIIFDVGRTNKNDGEDTRLVAFLKKGQVNYKSQWGKFYFGLIGMNTYGVQEKNWGYRFIYNSAIDKYGFTSTVDAGVGFSRSVMDNLNFSLLVVNGEGFKKPQADKYHKIAINTTYGESNLSKNDGYNAGVVYSTEGTDGDPTTVAGLFAGFAGMGIRLGGEYDMQTMGGVNSNIISGSVNYRVKENIDVFARYDIFEDGDTGENDDSKNYLIAGIVLTRDGGISVAPNVRMTTHKGETEAVIEYKVNFQFKF
ncbi:MAG: hypothetical protein H8E85_04720 [Candidatus Marinimicrobia bacterium]|nr:hypothetical protein [Candidatus Neomarinimicrobiota bacterium]